jgi:hypothetical protein
MRFIIAVAVDLNPEMAVLACSLPADLRSLVNQGFGAAFGTLQ